MVACPGPCDSDLTQPMGLPEDGHGWTTSQGRMRERAADECGVIGRSSQSPGGLGRRHARTPRRRAGRQTRWSRGNRASVPRPGPDRRGRTRRPLTGRSFTAQCLRNSRCGDAAEPTVTAFAADSLLHTMSLPRWRGSTWISVLRPRPGDAVRRECPQGPGRGDHRHPDPLCDPETSRHAREFRTNGRPCGAAGQRATHSPTHRSSPRDRSRGESARLAATSRASGPRRHRRSG